MDYVAPVHKIESREDLLGEITDSGFDKRFVTVGIEMAPERSLQLTKRGHRDDKSTRASNLTHVVDGDVEVFLVAIEVQDIDNVRMVCHCPGVGYFFHENFEVLHFTTVRQFVPLENNFRAGSFYLALECFCKFPLT